MVTVTLTFLPGPPVGLGALGFGEGKFAPELNRLQVAPRRVPCLLSLHYCIIQQPFPTTLICLHRF